MALRSLKRVNFSHYGAIVKDSTRNGCYDPLVAGRTVAESTVQQLTDPKTKDQLVIIGTTNLSTRLAARTKQLIEQIQPSSVLVQASPLFFDASRVAVSSQEDLDRELKASGYHYLLADESRLSLNLKNLIYLYKKTLISLFVHHTLRTPANWGSLFTPGLEIKYALDYAERVKAPVFYAGEELNAETHEKLQLQKDFDVIWPFLNYHLNLNSSWVYEIKDAGRLFQFHSLKDLSEEHFNNDVVAWWVRLFGTLFPKQKASLIDQRDEDLFVAVERKLTGNKKLAVVNQWHLEGLEKLWRKQHGIEFAHVETTGTEDLPLGELQAYITKTDSDREKVERLTGSPVASHHRQLVAYNDETRSHYG